MSQIDWTSALLLAQEANGKESPGGLLSFPMLLMLLVVVFYFIVIRPESNKRKAQQTMIDGLKKNDRVVTIGGIHGTVVNVHREADELVLKIDESTGAKMRINISAVARVGDDSSAADTVGKKTE